MTYIFYILLIVIFCHLGGQKNRLSILFRVAACLLYICFVGFRHFKVGVDSERYMELFYAIPNQNYQWIEIGFDRLIRILDGAGFSYTGLFLACITLTAIPIFFTLEKTKHYTLSAIMLYVLTLSTLMNGMRQCISVGLFFYGSHFIRERKMIPFFLCMTGALLFHYSCVFLLPFYFFLHRTLPKYMYIFVYAISFLFIFVDVAPLLESSAVLISGIGRNYAEDYQYYAYSFGSLSILGFLYNTSVNLLLFWLITSTNAQRRFPVMTNCSILSFALKNLSFNMPIVGRIAQYFAWFPFMLIPYLVVDSMKNRDMRRLEIAGILLLYGIGFFHSLFSSEMKMLPYIFNLKIFQ